MARTVRVAGVPGDFRVPRGWPTPTDRWIRANAFWVPPTGWTPTPGLRPAPAGWRFWRANPLWLRSKGHLYSRVNMLSRSGGVAVVVAIAARIASSLTGLEALAIVSLVAWCAGLVSYVAYFVLYVRITRRALREFAQLAEASRHQHLTREYQRYLLDVG